MWKEKNLVRKLEVLLLLLFFFFLQLIMIKIKTCE